MNPATYAADGVDVYEGDAFSAVAGKICRESYNNSPYVVVNDLSRGHFRGPRTFSFKSLPEGCTMDAAPDGIGTKVVLLDVAGRFREAAFDLVAMTCGDITRFGGMPLVFTNVLDVSTLGKSGPDATSEESRTNWAFCQMILGLGEVCRQQGLVMFKGETAELGQCVSSENPEAIAKFNWAGTAIGVYHPEKMITGDGLAPGQIVMALQETGFRSNGISSVRKAFRMKFGDDWFNNSAALTHFHQAARRSTLYDQFFCDINGWLNASFRLRVPVQSIIHVTGGAIAGKFGEDVLFPRGLSADLDNLWNPPQIMKDCAGWRGMDDRSCYDTWNCGQGALAVIDAREERAFRALATEYRISAQRCGTILASTGDPCIRIKSKFSGQEIIYTQQAAPAAV